MTEACATCGADDELLFTCRHCQRRFCHRHEMPHHACDRFGGSSPGTDTDRDATSTTASVERQRAAEPPSADPSGSPEEEVEPAGALRSTNAQRAVGVVSPSSTPRSLDEWLARQTYLTLLFKVGGLALLINVAFYGGVALTLYDPLGLL